MSLKPIPAEPTHAQRVTAAAQQLRDYQLAAYQTLRALHQDGMRLFWQAGYGITPQELADELGPDALLMFQRSALIRECVAAFDPADAPGVPPQWEVSVREDGTLQIDPVE